MSPKKRFKNSRPLEKPKGWNLPFGNIRRNNHGDGYLLLGDAATGHECTYAVCTRSANSNHAQIPVSGSFLDSPSTTSATTYKLQGSVGNDGGTMTLNVPVTVDAQSGNAASTITVMEVSA